MPPQNDLFQPFRSFNLINTIYYQSKKNKRRNVPEENSTLEEASPFSP